MITIRKSPTADNRTCDPAKVTRDQLLVSSSQHIEDVQRALSFFSIMLQSAGTNHDHTKLSEIDLFHKEFAQGSKEFMKGKWWQMHKRAERHHLNQPDGVRADVNLIDVLEYISDCVMAGKARSGVVYDITIDAMVLAMAFKNTCALLERQVVVKES